LNVVDTNLIDYSTCFQERSLAMPNQTEIIVTKLNTLQKYDFNITLETSDTKLLVKECNLLGLKKLFFVGKLQRIQKDNWKLIARLKAVVTQPCVTTLQPIDTQISTAVERLFIKGWENSHKRTDETVLNDDYEILSSKINLLDIITEEIILNAPLYPRSRKSADTSLSESSFSSPKNINIKPFSVLSTLRKKMTAKDESLK
jgi:uncharacterized metal-binding protein YceD (DUF177 family)